MPQASVSVSRAPADVPLPTWAAGMADQRRVYPCDGTQTVLFVGVNNRVGLAVGDSGAYMTVMDLQSAVALGLLVRRAVNGDCGSYAVPGGGVDRDYAGVVERPFELRLGGQVKFTLTGMRVIEHPFLLFLIGAEYCVEARRARVGTTQDSSCLPSHAARWWAL